MRRVYLDYAATTPISEGARKKMEYYFLGPPAGGFANTESTHAFGREAQKAVDEAREILAKAFGVSFREIIFTSSATEANNLALRGVVEGNRIPIKEFDSRKRPNIVISSIEHSSVYKTARSLENQGVEVRFARPNNEGVVSSEVVEQLIDSDTLLVSVMHGNNEIGSIQPIAEIGKIIQKFKAESSKLKAVSYPFFHTDAVQSFMYLGLHPRECGVDLATLSSHKLYGPKGAAAFYIREGVSLIPQETGGGHERGLRAGTLNVPAIAGFAEAVKEAEEKRKTRKEKIKELKKYFLESLKKTRVPFEVNGDLTKTLPHILNVYFSDARAEELMIALDMRGVAVSAGSACASGAGKTSRTVREISGDEKRARRSARFSFGEGIREEDVEFAISALGSILRS